MNNWSNFLLKLVEWSTNGLVDIFLVKISNNPCLVQTFDRWLHQNQCQHLAFVIVVNLTLSGWKGWPIKPGIQTHDGAIVSDLVISLTTTSQKFDYGWSKVWPSFVRFRPRLDKNLMNIEGLINIHLKINIQTNH